MTYILTIVSANKLQAPNGIGDVAWIAKDKALEVRLNKRPSKSFIDDLRTSLGRVDVFVTPAKNRVKKLLLADMDATIVEGETLDDLGAHAGLKDKIAAITARAMRGELDFHEALKERVALLKDLPETALRETLDKMTISKGAAKLIKGMKAAGATCVLVSGGFTFFTGAVAEKLGFDFHHGNSLEIKNARLTGRVIAPILDKNSKLEFLGQYVEKLGITMEDTITIGDGANDIPMLTAAGLGIGYNPKPAVETAVSNTIKHCGLEAALYAQGLV